MTPYVYIGPYVYVRVLPWRGWPRRWGFWGRIPETGPKAIRAGESLGHHPAFPLRSPLKGAGALRASAPFLMGSPLKLSLKGKPNRSRSRYVTGRNPLGPVTGSRPVTASQPLRLFQGGCRFLRTLRIRIPSPPLKLKAARREAPHRASARIGIRIWGLGSGQDKTKRGVLVTPPSRITRA